MAANRLWGDWFWRLAATLGCGFAFGTISAALFRERWNQPIHWVNIAFAFIVLPGFILCVTVIEKSYGRTSLHIGCLVFAYFAGSEFEWLARYGAFSEDMLSVLPFGAAYVPFAMLVTWRLRHTRRGAAAGPERLPRPVESGNPYQTPGSASASPGAEEF